jgi:hypothetical protein
MAIKTTYSMTPVDIQVGCSVEFYDSFTHGWTNYTPQCCCSDYDSYHLCTNLNLLQSRLPGWELTRLMSLIAKDALTYHLVALAKHPIYTIYSMGCVTMGLSFFYLPNPLPAHFIPHYTKGTPFHWLLFYQECQPTTHKQKWKSTEEPNPEALTSMYTAPPHLPHMP